MITANSPGEVAGWVKPAAEALKKAYPDSKISVFLPPCVFSSGSEKQVLNKINFIDYTYGAGEYLKYMIFRISPENFYPGDEGIVIFLGGDLLHAVFLGKRLDYPVIAYTEGVYSFGKSIDKFMVPYQKTADKLLSSGAEEEKVEIIGNLMLDAVETQFSSDIFEKLIDKDKFIISLFPGSRPAEVEYMLPFFMETIIDIQAFQLEKIIFMVSCSPFVDKEEIKGLLYNFFEKEKIDYTFLEKNEHEYLLINNKIEIIIVSGFQYNLMETSDLILTIPGTNNLEIAYFGTPMLVVLPLNKPEDIPLEGLVGLAGEIPVMGKFLKRKLVPHVESKIKYTSLINRIADEEIVPEIRGIISPADLRKELEFFLENKNELDIISKKLKKTAGSKGAVKSLLEITDQILASYHYSMP